MITSRSKNFRIVWLTILICIAIWTIIALINFELKKYIALNDTKSEPIGFYKLHSFKTVEIGKIYSIKAPDKYVKIARKLGYSGDGLFLKQIVAGYGDTITITKQGVLINNTLLPNSQSQEVAKGIHLHPIQLGFTYMLGQDEYWIYGEGKTSFDSRYFGVINRNSIHDNATFWFSNKGVEEWQKLLHSLWQRQTN